MSHCGAATRRLSRRSTTSTVIRSTSQTCVCASNLRCLTAQHDLSPKLHAVGPDLPDRDALRSADMILFAIPTQHMRPILKQVVDQLDHAKLPLLTFVNKCACACARVGMLTNRGIENGTDLLPHEVIADACGKDVADVCVFFSGPSFAKEIVRRQPTQVSIASYSTRHADRVAAIFHRPWLCVRFARPN